MTLGKSNQAVAVTVLFSLLVLSSCAYKNRETQNGGKSDSFNITDLTIGAGVNESKTDFNKKEKIWLSFDAENITAIKENGTSNFWLREDLIIRDSNGAIVMLQPNVFEIKKPISEKPVKFNNEISLSNVENLNPGKYSITILLTDLAGFQISAKTVLFRII